MKPEIANVHHTLDYAQSHDLAVRALPFTLLGLLLGLFLAIPLDGAPVDRKNLLFGGLAIAFSLVVLIAAVYRRSLPTAPSIVLSPQGILFRDISERVIPWSEIREVGVDNVSEARDFFSTRVTRIAVSKRYYEVLTGGKLHLSTVAIPGEPSFVFLSYDHPLPVDEFHEAVRLRWLAFSRHAESARQEEAARQRTATPRPDERPLVQANSPVPRRGGGAIQRASSFAGPRAFASLVRGSSPGGLFVVAASLLGMAALLTNYLGFWSTGAQERARARAAEGRAWQERNDASRKALDEDQRRTREMWDRSFECMDKYWSLHERRAYKQDPECMKRDK